MLAEVRNMIFVMVIAVLSGIIAMMFGVGVTSGLIVASLVSQILIK